MTTMKTMRLYDAPFEAIPADRMERWRQLPASVISDTLNRCQSMSARVKPCAPGMKLCGQARTVMVMPGDNSMVHHAVSIARENEVVVVANGGLDDLALVGEWVVRCCRRRGLGGLVTDGAVRDVAVIRELGFPVFATGAVPRGPHKNFGGRMDVVAAVGGTPVQPGDLIVGDDDGVVVVPLSMADEALDAAEALLRREEEWATAIENGQTLVSVLKVPAYTRYDALGREIEAEPVTA